MNVGQLIRSLVGELQPADAKTLELKVGQIVKGLVLQLLSEQDALVNIGGVQVRARLETPLKQGEVTLLQVQPESANGQIILKPLQSSGVKISEDSLAELLKNFGIKDQPTARQALQTLHREGIPLTKDNAGEFVRTVQNPPAGISDAEWEQTVLLALKKNMPLSDESLGSLHRALYGRPLNEGLERLSAQIKSALLSNGALPEETQQLMGRIGAVIDEVNALGRQIAAGFVSNEGEDQGHEARPSQPGGQPSTVDSSGKEANAAAQKSGGGDLPVRTNPGTLNARIASNAQILPGVPLQDVEGAQADKGSASTSVQPSAAGAILSKTASVQQVPGDMKGAALQSASPAAEPEAGQSQPLARLFKLLGVDYEQKIAKLLDGPHTNAAKNPIDGAPDMPLPVGMLAEEQAAVKHPASDALKSLLLQASGSDSIPQALKDQIHQVVQQITGQQLLLSPDRGAIFSHVTLMIPIQQPGGGQTASIHIQSRKGNRGELDADNCRLLFDLDMKTLGGMLVDVQVYNKIVSLNIHNDHPLMEPLLESQRTEISSGLEAVGYQLSSLKASPFPLKKAAEEPAALTVNSFYETKPYKSMDIRI